MYNRYIPQPDGSYRRNRMQEPERHPPREAIPSEPIAPPSPEPDAPPCPGCIHRHPVKNTIPSHRKRPNTNITGFLKQLLPKDFDMEDLLVVLLLLIMAGDCQEDQNAALLTLALYLFL